MLRQPVLLLGGRDHEERPHAGQRPLGCLPVAIAALRRDGERQLGCPGEVTHEKPLGDPAAREIVRDESAEPARRARDGELRALLHS